MRLHLAFGLLAGFGACKAQAQNHPDYLNYGGDELQLTCESDDRAVLYYLNTEARMSSTADHDLSSSCITIEVQLEATGGPEHITVTVPEGWITIPGVLTVEDGFQGEMLLLRGVFEAM